MILKRATTRSKLFPGRMSVSLAVELLVLAVLVLGPLVGPAPAAADLQPVSATKTVDHDHVIPGDIIQYTVVFSNTSADPVDLDEIRDTLPAGFTFLGMGTGDIIDTPVGTTGTIIWNSGPWTVAAGGTRTLKYNVLVDAPPSATPYSNHVEADLSTGETIWAEVDVTVEGPILQLNKTTTTYFVPDRDPLDYTVTLVNSGSSKATIDWISDVLPAQFRFLSMVSGPLGDPQQSGQTLTWNGPIEVDVGSSLVFTYRVRADGTVGSPHDNSVLVSYDGLTAGPDSVTVYVTIGTDQAYLPVIIKTPIEPPPPPVVHKLAYHTKPNDNYEIYSIEVDGTDWFNISNRSGGDLNPDWSPDGALVAWEHYGGNAEIYVANADGTNTQNITNDDGDDMDPDWRPDGSQILFRSNRDDRWDIFTMNTNGTNQHKLTGDLSCQSTLAKWSPSGAKIAFICGLEENAEVYVMNADGSNKVRLTDDSDADAALNWSPDNTKLVYVRVPNDADSEIWVANVDGSGNTRITTNTVDDFAPMWSPDGTKIVFTHEYADSEIAVMNPDGSGMTNLSNSSGGDFVPQWSPDGLKIAFLSNRSGNKELYVMNADGSGQLQLSNTSTDELHFDWWPKTP